MVREYSDELKEYLDIEDAEISQHPASLQNRLQDIDFDGNEEVLEVLREEAHRTVDEQIAGINDIDSKASKLLRLNILLLGLIISALSIATQILPRPDTKGSMAPSATIPLETFVNDYIIGGVALMIFSIVFAGLTYSTTDLDVGVGRDNLVTLLEADVDSVNSVELVVKNYISRINWNRSESIRILPLISLTITLTTTSLIFLAWGVHQVVFGQVPGYIFGGGVITILVTVGATGLLGQSIRAVADLRAWRKDISQ